MVKSKSFEFDGGAGTYWLNSFIALLITVLSLGIFYPYALVLKQRWIANHTLIKGRRLKFTGSAIGLFGNWVKWLFLIIITLGIYSIWVTPRIHKWVIEHTDFIE